MSNKCRDIKEQYDALTIQTDEFMRVFESEKASGVFVQTKKLMKSLMEAKENLEDKISFEGQALDYLESLGSALSKDHLAQSLCGFISKRTHQIRQKLLEDGVSTERILEGLAGDDSKEAWEIRDSIPKDENGYAYIQSLIGIDSPKSMKIRREYIDREKSLEYILYSLAGLDSKPARDMRFELKEKVRDTTYYTQSLTGLQSNESIEERRDLSKIVHASYIAISLIGTDPLILKDIRMECAKSDTKRGLLKSLAGVDSEYAWEQREEILQKPGVDFLEAVATSLAGLNSPKAWAMRTRLKERGASSLELAKSLAGDNLYFLGWYLRKKNKLKKVA